MNSIIGTKIWSAKYIFNIIKYNLNFNSVNSKQYYTISENNNSSLSINYVPDTALHYTQLSQNSTRLHSQVFQRAKLRRSEFKSQVWVDKYREDLNPCFSGVVLL